MKKRLIFGCFTFLLTLCAKGQTIPRPNIPAPQGLAVNSFTGNLFFQRNEQSLRGTGYRIYQSFYYNAATDTLNYGYGHGWSFYYNVFYREASNRVIIHHADAKKDTFLLQAGSYKSPAGVFDVLTKAGSQFTLTAKNGEKQIFADGTHKKVTRMEDANGNFVIVDYTNGNPTRIANSSGRSLLMTWTNGLLTEAKDGTDPAKKFSYLYNATKDLIAVIDPLSRRKSFSYQKHYLVRLGDENSNPVVIAYVGNGGKVKQITSCNTEQRFTFLNTERKTFVTQKAQSSNVVTGYDFDNVGRLSAITDPDGNRTEFSYDASNNLLTQKDFKGQFTRFAYDNRGNVLTETDPLGNKTEYTYEGIFNNPLTIKDKRGNTTAMSYDAKGNLTSLVRPGSLTDNFTYDAAGRRLTARNANTNTTTYQYNTDGDLVRIQYPVGAVQYQYNGNCCNVSRITDANGNTLDMTYDLLNRTKTVRDGQSNTTSYEYDAVGNVTKETDPNGYVKEYGYDALNRLTSVKLPVGIWQYEYDGQSNLITMSDANGHTTRYTYNKRNELVQETDPLGKSVGYRYDLSGNLTQRLDPNGNTVTYLYDPLNRLIEKSYTGNVDKYSYDEVGNLISAYNNTIAYSFEYDNLNQLLKKNILTWNKALAYTYDNVGNRKTMTDYDGGVTTYTYDANNRLTALKNPANLTTVFEYDAGRRLKKQINGNSTYSTYHYDAAGRMDSLINWKNSSEKISLFYYTFDQYGNRKTLRDKRGLHTYTYDTAHRLTNVAYADASTESFQMDGTGNRTQRTKNGVVTPYTYNAADQIQTAGPTSFTFDANGNTIGQIDTRPRTYRYDGENRLLEIQFGSQRRVQYRYDPFGDKVEKQDTLSVLTKMLYDGDNLIRELNVGNITQNAYTTAFGMDSWLSMRTESGEYFFHKDGLNSTVELTGTNTLIANQYTYDVYGNLLAQSGTVNNKVMYTGRLFDGASQLYDYRSRFYDAKVGRFIIEDKFSGVKTNPSSISKYLYVENNPVNYIDPRGFFKISGFDFITNKIFKKPYERIDKANDVADLAQATKCIAERNKQENAQYVPNPGEPELINFIGIRSKQEERLVGEGMGQVQRGANVLPYYPNSGEVQNDPCKKDPPQPDGLLPAPLPEGNQDPLPPNPNQDPNKGVTPVGATDPNEIIGPAGYDSLYHWVSVKQSLLYKVLFENDPDFATAPAQNVTVYVPIHTKLNPSSLRLSDFGFGSFNFTVPPNTSIYSRRLDLRDSLGVFVDLTAGLDIANRRAFWIFQSIDPATGLAATLPANSGFLPVNDTTRHNGEGYVTFTLIPSANAQTRDTVSAQASIIFDIEETINTNRWVNTIDAFAPTSNIGALAAVVDSVFNVSWTSRDDANGSGVKDHILYVSKNSGPFTLYKDKLTALSEQIAGDSGSSYAFYTRALDNAGNIEMEKTAGDRMVTVKVPATSSAICLGASINYSTSAIAGATYRWQVNVGSGFVDLTDNTVYTGTASPQLTIQQPPNTYYGYQYRAMITVGSTVSYSPVRQLRFSSTWLGIAGDSWHNPANWSCGIIPDAFTDATIPGNVPSNPILNANGTCRSLSMGTNGKISIRQDVKLKLGTL